jgi:predicted TPR repeat methyltransferase
MICRPDPIAEADALVRGGEPARAFVLLRKLLASGKGGILTHIALSRALLASAEIDSALAAAREACTLAPGISDAALALGEALLAAGHLPTAISEFQRAVELDPASDAARLALGSAWLEAGEADRAAQILADIPSTSYFAGHAAAKIAAAAEMRRAQRSAPGYVRHLFDQFAPDYDRRMLEELSYRAPHILRGLADMLMICEPGALSILDLGCGTGLSGAAFNDLAARLDGIDLSPKMIEAARARSIYDGLSVADIESVLAQQGLDYDLIVAADTLVYLGDLSPVLRGARHRLKPGGFFLFTVEKHDGQGFELGPKRRYRHCEAYLRKEAAAAGLDVMGLINCSPRDEAAVPVEGFAVALQPADTTLAAN